MMPERANESELPRSTGVSKLQIDNFLLTNSVWENSMGSYEPETGVRYLDQTDTDGRARFVLIQHRWRDFQAANDLIVKALRKGWPAWRIEDLMCKLKERKPR